MATKEMTIKLMVDTESNRLIFAEASNDFVDFLIYLLSLPIGTATKLLTSESMVGSIGNIYTSVANLDVTYLRPDVNRNVILDPMVFPSGINTPLPAATSSSRKFYTCGNPACKRRGISDVRDEVQCPGCHGDIYLEIPFIDKDSEGYVDDVASYMISDDLSITSISTVSIMSMMNKFNVTKPEERVVKIGTKEALEMLKASLQSTTVLTDVFLKRKMRKLPDDSVMAITFTLNGKWQQIAHNEWTYSGGTSYITCVKKTISFEEIKAEIYNKAGINPLGYKLNIKLLYTTEGVHQTCPIEIRDDNSWIGYLCERREKERMKLCVDVEQAVTIEPPRNTRALATESVKRHKSVF